MDWRTSLLLAGIAWIDGVRRVPPGALVLRRVLGGRWVPAAVDETADRWQVVASWAPITASVVLSLTAGRSVAEPLPAPEMGERLHARLAAVEGCVRALRVLGTLAFAALVLGVPWAAHRFNGWGLIAGVALVLVLSLATSAVAAWGFCSAGGGRWAAARGALPFVSPFAAPHAANAVFQRAVAGSPADLVARRLLAPADFASLIRRRAYDAVYRGRTAPSRECAGAARCEGDALTELLGAELLATIVAAPPADCGPGELFCPRCGGVYRAGIATCPDCAGLALALAPSGA